VTCFSEALDLFPDTEKAQNQLEFAKAELSSESKFLQAVTDAQADFDAASASYEKAKAGYDAAKTTFDAKGLEKDLKKALVKLDVANNLRPADRRVVQLGQKARELDDKHDILKQEKKFDERFKMGNDALDLKEPDLRNALKHFGDAVALVKVAELRRADAATSQKMIADIKKAEEGKQELQAAQKALEMKDRAGALRSADRLADGRESILSNLLLYADKRLAPLVDEMATATCAVYRGVMEHIRDGAKGLEDNGKESWDKCKFASSKKKYSETIDELKEAEKVRRKIKDLSAKLKNEKLSAKAAEGLPKIKSEIAAKIEKLEDFNRTGEELDGVKKALDQGQEEIDKGMKLLAHKRDAAKLHEAEYAFGRAKGKLEAAAKKLAGSEVLARIAREEFNWEDPAKLAGEAAKQAERAARMICPFELDMQALKQFPTGWHHEDSWSVGNRDEKYWLQAKGTTATLRPPTIECFPADFELELEIGPVAEKAKLPPQWGLYEKSLTVWLVGKGKGANFWISLCNDDTNKFTRDNKNVCLLTKTLTKTKGVPIEAQLVLKTEPVRIRLKRVGNDAKLFLNAAEKSFVLPQEFEFHQVSIETGNGALGIFRASLRIHEPTKSE